MEKNVLGYDLEKNVLGYDLEKLRNPRKILITKLVTRPKRM